MLLIAGAVTWGAESFWPATRSAAPVVPVAAAAPAPPPTLPPPTTTTAPPPPVPASTFVAAPKGKIPTFTSPGSAPSGSFSTWYGYSLSLPVISAVDGWVEVRMPQRPNGSTAWLRYGDVTLSSTPYRIIVSVGRERLTVYKSGYPVLEFPIGVGVPATPTVTGNYFITVRAPAPNAGYGPFVLSTSAHSDAIQSWEGMGDAIIAIHGPITSYADQRIGTTGVQISNGCIRLHDADLVQLSVIPLGTPVDINA
jgi:lipoprotein-anchoring transpeptidase ErfK/SrfK